MAIIDLSNINFDKIIKTLSIDTLKLTADQTGISIPELLRKLREQLMQELDTTFPNSSITSAQQALINKSSTLSDNQISQLKSDPSLISGNTLAFGDAESNALYNVGSLISLDQVDKLNKNWSDLEATGLTTKQLSQLKTGNIIGAASDLLNSFLPEKREYSGQKGAITAGLDSAYDQLADAANKFGPVGSMIGGIMKGSAALGKVTNMIGGGTSGMTTKDAILGSNFLNMTPLGLVNGFGGRTTSTITKDNEAFAQVGSSYGGTENTVDEALEVSGKKYGLLSNSERKKAERQLAEARRLQSIIQGISDDALIRSILQGTMSDILSNRYGLLLQGGYNLSAIHVGKRGLKVSPYKARRLTSNVTFKFLPKEVEKDKQGTVIEPADLNLIITTFKEGGSVPTKVGTVLKPSKIETIIEPVLIITEIAPLELDLIQTFLNGGEINIIPDGALHKNLHHMEDAEHLTKKGIPVVTIDGDELVAEIEKSEIILRKSVTEKLEELCKLYYSEDITKKEKDEYALEAGLMLVDEILNNTIDNTNKLL